MSQEQKEEGPRSFARFIEQLDGGSAHAEASAELNKLVGLLEARAGGGKAKGKLVFELTLELEKSHVAATYDIKMKEPAKKRAGDFFFVTKGHNLSRQDERQMTLPTVREVPPANQETRDAGGEAGAAREAT